MPFAYIIVRSKSCFDDCYDVPCRTDDDDDDDDDVFIRLRDLRGSDSPPY